MRAASSQYLICCSLVFDEMVIRKRIQFNGQQILGFVDMAEQIVANEALIFMLTNLILTCLSILHETGVRIISLTFDGLSTNFSLLRILGCDINPTL